MGIAGRVTAYGIINRLSVIADRDLDPRRNASREHWTNQAQIRPIVGADKARIKHRYTQINYNTF